VQGLIR